MIHEYALDPKVLLAWSSNTRDYAEFMREYGLGTPRLISLFPKKKVSKLRSYFLRNGPVDSESLQFQRYTEMVSKMVETLILREFPEPQLTDWNDIVKVENGRSPFNVVLSSQVIDTERNITLTNMYLRDSIWNHPCQASINRTVAGFSSIAVGFLRLAIDKVVIVDTYGWTQKAIKTVQYFINSIRDNRVNPLLPSIHLYYKEKRGSNNSGIGSPDAAEVKRRILQGVSEYLSDINLEVFELQEIDGNDVFHNRCILTEHGGILTGHGIGVSGDEAHTDDAILMKSDLYEKKWWQFVEDNCFQIMSHDGSKDGNN